MSNISYQAYMDKIVFCCTLQMTTVIIVLYLCMVTTCLCMYMYVQECLKNSHSICAQRIQSCMAGPVLVEAFITCMQYKHLGNTLSWSVYYVAIFSELSISQQAQPTIACSICYVQLAITFTLQFGLSSYSYIPVATYCSYAHIDFSEFECQNHS